MLLRQTTPKELVAMSLSYITVVLWCRGTHMEGVDLRICPVDQLLREVAPFYNQHVDLPIENQIKSIRIPMIKNTNDYIRLLLCSPSAVSKNSQSFSTVLCHKVTQQIY